ncbi:Low-affinity CO2 hydration protein CphX [Synechococcus sp. WH 8101]|uniref:CO2 hydration protein n=1 Tax=Synechococcus sp. WH 8101 TaxID=59932 RepID=UPI0010230EBD|nr:CO2 hydration protein [Synechococcus sp. WH 8101]QBE69561.1 Low-affinity CO2 hydration protein CphX [Synechococcus sp. WH 8101]QNI45812.1 CO2 hydration protein [Synechococcus sp. WH 8101]
MTQLQFQSPLQTPPDREQLIERLLGDVPLLADTPDHLLQVVNVLESYGIVLDAYSRNLVYQGQTQLLNPFPVLRFFHDGFNLSRLWQHLAGDRINFEYAEYCQKAMFWHGTGGLDAYLDSPPFLAACDRIIQLKRRRDPLLAGVNALFPGFAPEAIRSLTTIYALGLFWRVMSDLFLDLARCYRLGEVASVQDVVHHIRDGLVAAAADPITYQVQLGGEAIWILPPEAGLTFLADVAVPYVEAVFFRGMPFLGTVSYNAQAQQISPDPSSFRYGALYADPLPSMGAGIPPSLCMQDMYRHLPEELSAWYEHHGRGQVDVHVQICISFQKSMFCVTNGAIAGTMPHPLDSQDPEARKANLAYAQSWVDRLMGTRREALI